MASEAVVSGSIVDSWVERRGPWPAESRLVIQVAPLGEPGDLWIVEASPALVPDDGWLADLRENLCHGSPVSAEGWVEEGGFLTAKRLRLER
jgi:hypothetical protein